MKLVTKTTPLILIFLFLLPSTIYSQQRYQYSHLWTDSNTGANPVWRDYKNLVEASVPEIGINGGLKLNAYLNVTSEKYEFIIEGKAFLDVFGIKKPSWTSYYFKFQGKDFNTKYYQSEVSPKTFIVDEVQVEITNEFVPEFYLLLPITMAGKWVYPDYENKDVQLYDKLLGYKTDLGVKIKENSGKNDATISGLKHGFKVKLVKKGRIVDNLLISDLRNFIDKKAANVQSTAESKDLSGTTPQTSSQNSSNNTGTNNTNYAEGSNNDAQPTQLDFWGNPVKAESNTVNYGGSEVENNAHYQQQMQQRQNTAYASEEHDKSQASQRKEVDDYNNATYDQAYEIASTDVSKDFEDAKKQLNTGSGDALIKSSVALSRSATNSAQATTGAIGFGVGVVLKASENAAKRKAAQEEQEERERQQKAEAARIAKAKMVLKNTRLNVFKGYPAGELPLSSTQSTGKNLYYFVYSFKEADLQDLEVDIFLTNIFAVGKYPDSTWPMQTKLVDQINALTPLEEVICGPFYTLSEANGVYASFSGRLNSTGMKAKQVDYGGFNAHAETSGDMPAATPKLDFWGNPIKD